MEGLILLEKIMFMRKNFIAVFIFVLAISVQTFAQRNFEYPPAPLFSNVLQTVEINRQGELNFNPVFVYFLPSDKGKLKVMHEGNELGVYTWTATPGDNSGKLFKISGFDWTGNGIDPRGMPLKSGGKYELVYEANGKPFYKHAFVLEKSKSDPYNPKSEFVVRGDIENYAYLIKNGSEWKLKLWLRNDVYKRKFGVVEIFKDGKKVAESDTGKMPLTVNKEWKRFEFGIKNPIVILNKDSTFSRKRRGGGALNFATLKDGMYTIKFTLDGKLHGTYKLEMKGGEIQMQDRQKEGTNPLRYIEGGGEAFWVKRV